MNEVYSMVLQGEQVCEEENVYCRIQQCKGQRENVVCLWKEVRVSAGLKEWWVDLVDWQIQSLDLVAREQPDLWSQMFEPGCKANIKSG